MDIFEENGHTLLPLICNLISKLGVISVIICYVRTCDKIKNDKNVVYNVLHSLYFYMAVVNVLSFVPTVLDIIYKHNGSGSHNICIAAAFIQTYVDIAGLLLITTIIHILSRLTWMIILKSNVCIKSSQIPDTTDKLMTINICMNKSIDIRYILFILSTLLSLIPFIKNSYGFYQSRCYINNNIIALLTYHLWLNLSWCYALINIICIPFNLLYNKYRNDSDINIHKDTIQKLKKFYIIKSWMFPVFILLFSILFYIHLFVKKCTNWKINDYAWDTINVSVGNLFGLVPSYMYFQVQINNYIAKMCCYLIEDESSNDTKNGSSSIGVQIKSSLKAHDLIESTKYSQTTAFEDKSQKTGEIVDEEEKSNTLYPHIENSCDHIGIQRESNDRNNNMYITCHIL